MMDSSGYLWRRSSYSSRFRRVPVYLPVAADHIAEAQGVVLDGLLVKGGGACIGGPVGIHAAVHPYVHALGAGGVHNVQRRAQRAEAAVLVDEMAQQQPPPLRLAAASISYRE